MALYLGNQATGCCFVLWSIEPWHKPAVLRRKPEAGVREAADAHWDVVLKPGQVSNTTCPKITL